MNTVAYCIILIVSLGASGIALNFSTYCYSKTFNQNTNQDETNFLKQ